MPPKGKGLSSHAWCPGWLGAVSPTMRRISTRAGGLFSSVLGGGALYAYLDDAPARSLVTAHNALIVGYDYKYGPASKLPGEE